jgi:hypothetical protein
VSISVADGEGPASSTALKGAPSGEEFKGVGHGRGDLDIEPLSNDSCIDAEGVLFKLHDGHGLRCASETPSRSSILSVSHVVDQA